MSAPEEKPASTINAVWSIELNAYCPACGEYVDLVKDECFWEGGRIDAAEHGTARSNHLEVQCPECRHEFEVCCSWW
jgi:hypothetical protein